MAFSTTSNNKNLPAIRGENRAGGDGVVGKGARGIVGEGEGGSGVKGESDQFHGVFGFSHGRFSAGVFGDNDADGMGVMGHSSGGPGVLALSDSGIGVSARGGRLAGLFEGPLAVRTNGAEALRVGATGNVGIGTPDPTHGFHVRTFDAVGLFESTGTQAFLRLSTREGINNRVEITNRPGGRLSLFTMAGDVLNITRGGNVGIGTVTPAARLSVNGDVEVTGDIRLLNADCAEDFDVAGAEETQPGTVMIIDEGGALKRSHQAYDNRVAGVVSGAGDLKPGIILDKGESNGGRLPIALMGKVACKVDARHSPIGVGDLLTTSSTPGYAMKAANPFKAFGAVLGKALCPLKEGQGLIPVLVALQ